jgi:hypothetical protein
MLDFLVERIKSFFVCKMFCLQTLDLFYNKFLLKLLHIHFEVLNSCVIGFIVLFNEVEVYNLRRLIRMLIKVFRVSPPEDLSYLPKIVIKLLETFALTQESKVSSLSLIDIFSLHLHKVESLLIPYILHVSALLFLPYPEYSVPIVRTLDSHVELFGRLKALL